MPLILCGAGLVAFVAYEEYFAAEPMIRTRVFKNRTAAVSYFGSFMHGLVLWCSLYYLPLYYEAVHGYSPLIAGVALFPETFTVAPAAMAVGVAVSVTGRYRWAVWTGWFLTTLGGGLLILMDVDTSIPEWIFLNLVFGLGTGFLFPSLALALQAAAMNDDMGYAVTLFAFFRSFGQAIGVAVGGVIFQNALNDRLLGLGYPADRAAELSRNAAGLAQAIKGMPDGDGEKDGLRNAYADSLKIVWIVVCALAGLTFVVSFWTKGLPLDRELESEQRMQPRRRRSDEERDGEKGGSRVGIDS